MFSEEQKFRDREEGKVSIECKACGEIGQRIFQRLAEKGELIGLTCQYCRAPLEFNSN